MFDIEKKKFKKNKRKNPENINTILNKIKIIRKKIYFLPRRATSSNISTSLTPSIKPSLDQI